MLGGGRPPDGVKMRIVSANTTSLNLERLQDILAHKKVKNAQVLLLQETRLVSHSPGWVRRAAKAAGWRVLASWPPPGGRFCAARQGGTAIFWKAAIGKVATYRNDTHRQVAIKCPAGTISSAYGPASCTDVAWCENAIDWVQGIACGQAWCLAGDLNWKKSI